MNAPLSKLLWPLVGVLAVAGCGGEPTTVIDSPVVGSWAAISVDGQPLPLAEDVVYDDLPCRLTLSSLEFTFSSNGRYTGADAVMRRCTGQPDADVSSAFRGRWRVSGDLLYMRPDRGVEEASRFQVSGSDLTISYTDDDGVESVTVMRRR